MTEAYVTMKIEELVDHIGIVPVLSMLADACGRKAERACLVEQNTLRAKELDVIARKVSAIAIAHGD